MPDKKEPGAKSDAATIAGLIGLATAILLWLKPEKRTPKEAGASCRYDASEHQNGKARGGSRTPPVGDKCVADNKWKSYLKKPKNKVSILVLFALILTLVTYGCQDWLFRDQEQRQLRAYVGPQKNDGTPTITANCQFCGIIDPAQQAKSDLIVLVKNFGLTPAYRPTNCIVPIPIAAHEAFDAARGIKTVEEKCGSAVTRPTVWPQEERSYVSTLSDDAIQLFRKATAKEIDLYLAGLITYDDVFGNSHKTYICYMYLLVDGKQAWESCAGVFGKDD